MATAKAKTARAAVDPTVLLERARSVLAKEGVAKLATLGPAAGRAALVAELVKQGFEVSKTVVRKPLAAQLSVALADGAFIPLRTVGSHVVGSSTAEAKRAALALVASGGAKLVLRGTEEVLVPGTSRVLSREELAEFAQVAKSVAKVASAKGGLSLLQRDLLEALERVTPGIATGLAARQGRTEAPASSASTSQASGEQVDADLSRLFSAVDATRDPGTGLSFVPKIVATLRPQLGPEKATGVLLAAALDGLLELRPEGGIHRLSDEELALCPEGPHGTRLSWARRTEMVER
jgi:hypothetical protein